MNIYFLKKNIKYFIVLIFLSSLFFLGQRFNSVDYSTVMIKLQQKQTEKIKKGVYESKSGSKPTEIDLPGDYKKGDYIRLLIDLETKNELLYQNYENRPIEFSIYAASEYGNEQLIGQFSLTIPSKSNSRELAFKSEFNIARLIIKRTDTRKTGDLIISNTRVYRLNISDSGLGGLRPTIIGGYESAGIVFQTSADPSGRYPFIFNRKQELFGQTFKSDIKQISSVDLALLWKGTGGSGDYIIELKEVLSEGVYSDSLAYYYFNKEVMQDNSLGKSVYRIPLAANLSFGKTYIVTISNYGVKFNLFNTLKVGSPEIGNNKTLPAVTKIREGKVKSIPPLFMKVNGIKCREFLGSCLPNGVVVQDLGDGNGQYNYMSVGESTDILDLYKYDPSTVYDNLVGGLIASAKGETSFYYKFNTIYTINELKITLDQSLASAADNRLFYSFDDKNWRSISQNEDGDPIFQQVVTPPSNNERNFYLKITYDPDDARYKHSIFFGLEGINIEASLVVK